MSNRVVPTTDLISYGYGLTVLAGGLIGYFKAGSIPSLAAGLFFGSAAVFGAYQLSQNPKNFTLAILTSSALLTVMGMRYYNGGKFMPAGLIAALSLLQTARLGARFLDR